MVASVMMWCLVAALGQAPSPPEEAAWLKAVPADADVVLRLRGIEPVRNDLVRMLEAMSPTAAARAKPALDRGLERIRTGLGEEVVPIAAPVLSVLRLPKPGAPQAAQASAIFVRTNDYPALQRAIAGKDQAPQPRSRPGGYEALAGADGTPFFTSRGDGFAVVSNDEDLIRDIARRESSLDRELGPELRGRLLGGDAGLYVNLAAVRTRYRDEIEGLRRAFLGGVERGAAGAGGAKVGAMVRAMYGGMFDALTDSRALALSADLAAEGLVVTGRLALVPDSPTARRLAGARAGTADLLARLPDDAAFYLDLTADPSSYESLQKIGLSFMGGAEGAAEPSAALQAAMRLQREAGPREVAGSNAFGREGVKTLNLMTFADPRKAVESLDLTLRALRPPGLAWVKDLKLDPGAETYRGFSLSRATLTLDLDKLAELQPNTPGGAAALKAMLGETLTTWYGTDGNLVLSVAAKDWEEARAMIDAVSTGRGSIGRTDGFRAVRSRLPEQLGGAFLLSAQGLVQQMSAQLSALQPDNPDLKPPHDLPEEPALLGGALTPATDGYQFHLVVPNAVGPVIEQGLLPLFQGVTGKTAR